MKKILLLSSSILLTICLVGCFGKKPDEKEINDVTIEKEATQTGSDNNTDEVWDVTKERPEEFAEPDGDEPLADYGDEDNPIISFFPDLWKLEKTPDNVSLGQLRADMDLYLKYYFPDIDKQYTVSVIENTETVDEAFYSFKVNVEGLKPDGSDLEVECLWYYIPIGETGHYVFISDVTPDGTRIRVDKDGNPIDWDAPLYNPFAEE